jgi:hypothetical protein
MAENADSSRFGTAVELLIAATCVLTSGFRLNVSTSLVDDEGVDLVFHRRGAPATLAVQVKSRSINTTALGQRARFIANVRDATFSPRTDLYMLFVAVDEKAGVFEDLWLVPSTDFGDMTNPDPNGRRRFSASANPKSKDRWSGYRYQREELATQILSLLDGS